MKFVSEKIRENRRDLLRTLVLYLGLFCHGTGLAILGPSLLDLQAKTQSKIDEVTYVIVGRAVGLGVGSMANIYFSKKIHLETLLTLAFAGASISEAIVPLNSNVWLMVLTIVINGFFFGIIESGGTIYLIGMWKKQCAPFLQALHFSFGLGALVAPLYTRCFLVAQDADSSILPNPNDIQVHWAYIINAALMLSVSAIFGMVRMFNRQKFTRNDVDGGDHRESVVQSDEILPPSAKVTKCFVYITGMLFIFLYCGIEISIGSYLTPFAVECQLHLSKQTAALMASVYWSAFTFARLSAIVYLSFIGVLSSLLISLTFVGVSNIFLFGFGDTLEWALWAGIVFNGIGLSAIWGSLFAYIAKFMPCTGTLTSILICSACVGECVMPIITSIFIGTNPDMFQWIVLISSILMILSFALLATLLKLFKKFNVQLPNPVNSTQNDSTPPPSYIETMTDESFKKGQLVY